VKQLKAAVNKAKEDTAVYMTAELRRNALSSGWHPEVVANMSVVHDNGSYKVTVHPDYTDRAFVHEYGNENSSPTAVIRKYSNNNTHGKAFKTLLTKHYGGN
jgi:hypothetical protein